MTPYDWLLAYVPGQKTIERVVQTGAQEEMPIYNTVFLPVNSWSDYATKVYDGEGNVIGENPWWFQQTQYILSPNDWAAQKSVQQWGVSLDPNGYEWVILGEYAMPGRREWIFELLKSAGDAAGVPANYDWTPGLVYGAQDWWQHNEPFRWLETPAVFPVHMALAYASREFPALAPFVQQTGPGSAIWEQSLAEAHARRDAHKAVHRSMNLMIAAALTAGAAAAYFAPAAAGAGAGAEAGAGAAAGAAAGTTATVQGAELAALIEAGTAGAEGAFLEAAALSGAAVEYSTATGALLSATLPSGAVVAFDAAIDPFAEMGVQAVAEAAPAVSEAFDWSQLATELEGAQAESAVQNAALSELAGDVAPGTLAQNIGEDAAAQYLGEAAQVLGPGNTAVAQYMEQAGQQLVGKLLQIGKQKLAQELVQAFGGEAPQAPSAGAGGTTSSPYYGYEYGDAGAFEAEGGLQPTTISGKLIAAAKPLGLGAGIGLLALAVLGGKD